MSTKNMDDSEDIEWMRRNFFINIRSVVYDKQNDVFSKDEYDNKLSEVKVARQRKQDKQPLSTMQYRRLNKYSVMNEGGEDVLIANGPEVKRYLYADQMFDIIHEAHISTRHKRLKGLEQVLGKKYKNISRTVIDAYLKLCTLCQNKSKKSIAKNTMMVVTPLLVSELNSRCQVNILNMPSDGEFNHIMHYMDVSTKFCVLRPLKAKSNEEVVFHLLQIFCMFGAPNIMHCNVSKDFTIQNQVALTFGVLWQFFEPVVFGLVGAQIRVAELPANTVGLAAACVLGPALVRFSFTLLLLCGSVLNLKEKFFVALAWMAKATVQAVLGPSALDLVRGSSDTAAVANAQVMFVVCVISILLTAPLGAVIIATTGPRLLQRETTAPAPQQQQK